MISISKINFEKSFLHYRIRVNLENKTFFRGIVALRNR